MKYHVSVHVSEMQPPKEGYTHDHMEVIKEFDIESDSESEASHIFEAAMKAYLRVE